MTTTNIDGRIKRLKEYQNIGLDKMIHMLVAQVRWQPFKGTRDRLHLLVPVDNVYPSNIQPPYELEDKIENVVRGIPSNDFEAEGLKDKLYALTEFDAEIKKYNIKVEEAWKEDGVENDIEGQIKHDLSPHRDINIDEMLYEFECVLPYPMFDRDRKLEATNKRILDSEWKTVSNKSFLLWDCLENATNFEMCLLINTSIYDYMMILKGDRVLDEDDVFYYPIKEFEAWADKHGQIYDRRNTILEYKNCNIELDEALRKLESEKFMLEDLRGIGINDLTIMLDKAKKTIRFTRGRGNKSITLQWEKTGLSESRFELLYSYAVLSEQTKIIDDAHLIDVWNEMVCGDKKIGTVERYQREISKYFKDQIGLSQIFEKKEGDTHPQAGGSEFRYACNLKLTTPQGNEVVAYEKGWTNQDAMTRVNSIDRKKNMEVKINARTGEMEEVKEKKEDIY